MSAPGANAKSLCLPMSAVEGGPDSTRTLLLGRFMTEADLDRDLNRCSQSVYSIASSARVDRPGGTSKPMAFPRMRSDARGYPLARTQTFRQGPDRSARLHLPNHHFRLATRAGPYSRAGGDITLTRGAFRARLSIVERATRNADTSLAIVADRAGMERGKCFIPRLRKGLACSRKSFTDAAGSQLP